MATWRQIFTTNDVVPVNNGGTGASALPAGNVVSNGTTLQSLDQNTGTILVGQGTNAIPTPQLLGGDIGGVAADGGVTIANNAITTVKIIDDAVTLAKMADGTKGQLISYNGDGEATHLGVGDNGFVLTADSEEATGLKWQSAGGATTLNVQNGDTQSSALPVVFASGVSSTAAVYGDADELTFDADGVTFNHLSTDDLGQSDGNLTSELDGVGRAALFSKNGFKGDLAGRASAANFVKADASFVNDDSASLTGTINMLGVQSSVTNGDYYQSQSLGSRVTYDVTSDTLSVPNLTVAGTTTTVNSTVTTIADSTIRIADGTTASGSFGDSAASAGGAGLVVDVGSAADANLGRFIYTGYDQGGINQNSVLGWKIAQESVSDGSATANAYGVGVMYVQSGPMDEDGNGVDINPGALLFTTDSTGQLWLQVA
mgnify:CR=1 FL=1